MLTPEMAVKSPCPFAQPAMSGDVLVGASVLSADFGTLASEAGAAIESGADMLHVDVMDGHFVPNLSMGPAVTSALRSHLPEAILDVHLMVDRPDEFVMPFVSAGANHITIHIESQVDHAAVADMIHSEGCTAGLAINPDTPVQQVRDLSTEFDLHLVMSVHPGYSGQAFIPEVLPKVTELRTILGETAWIQMDGGVSPSTSEACRAAGCNMLVSASAIFGSQSYGDSISALRGETSG